jgi:Na+/proline symporter
MLRRAAPSGTVRPMGVPNEVWIVAGLYVVLALAVGAVLARKAGGSVEEFFLSGRRLPWWAVGTSMVATTFASDTPLVITGWVRDSGIWQNWQWWCLAGGGMLTTFLFARYWRRGKVMTTAELAELRYGGGDAKLLRFVQGVFQAGLTNTIILCWVILAAAKILGALFEADKVVAVTLASVLALAYSTMAGFWAVVVTDVVQFVMAMVGSIALAIAVWNGVGGVEAIQDSLATGVIRPEQLAFFPPAGPGSWMDGSFWTVPLVTACVFLGVQWWATDQVDGGGHAVQRISAARTEKDGLLGSLWYNLAHYALRPWPWILVAVCSLVVLPPLEAVSPIEGKVVDIDLEVGRAKVSPGPDFQPIEVDLFGVEGAAEDWRPSQPKVSEGDAVQAGTVLAASDPEAAYVTMARRYLTNPWMLGILVASLLAAFMSTVDTHTNLAASFFVNDLYRRFFRKNAADRHYVLVARLASVAALALGAGLAWANDRISDLYTFFLAFLSGVGPVYILRWLWWRVRATTEIVAMVSSALAASALTFGPRIAAGLSSWSPSFAWLAPWSEVTWELGPLSEAGQLTVAGRLILVVTFSTTLALLVTLILPRPSAERLTGFYLRVRPLGWWEPVRVLCPGVPPAQDGRAVVLGVIGGLLTTYGMLFAIGSVLFEQGTGQAVTWTALAGFGAVLVTASLFQLEGAPALEVAGEAAADAGPELGQAPVEETPEPVQPAPLPPEPSAAIQAVASPEEERDPLSALEATAAERERQRPEPHSQPLQPEGAAEPAIEPKPEPLPSESQAPRSEPPAGPPSKRWPLSPSPEDEPRN